MTVSLLIADRPPPDKPLTFESVPLDENRWEAWRAKGRLADAAFAETMKSAAMAGVALAGVVGAFWIGFE